MASGTIGTNLITIRAFLMTYHTLRLIKIITLATITSTCTEIRCKIK